MAQNSKIEWTDYTWNPTRGCTRVSPGCVNCYAERQAIRQAGSGKAYEGLVKSFPGGPRWTGDIKLVDDVLNLPKRWRDPKVIFVNSMSDLFHERLTVEQIRRVFDTMVEADHHIYQILTKRAERLEELSPQLPWPDHIWMGVSVENADYKWRIDHLRRCNAAHKFLSCEPLIGSLGVLDLRGIDWVIVGGESGPGARPMEADWVREIRGQCLEQGAMFHFKQWGGVRKGRTGRELDGRTWDEMPTVQPDPAPRKPTDTSPQAVQPA